MASLPKPHGSAELFLYPTGGRQTPLTAEIHHVILSMHRVVTPASECHDCSFLLRGTRIGLGERAIVPIWFLARETFSRLEVGQTFYLWEGKTVGEATIVSLT